LAAAIGMRRETAPRALMNWPAPGAELAKWRRDNGVREPAGHGAGYDAGSFAQLPPAAFKRAAPSTATTAAPTPAATTAQAAAAPSTPAASTPVRPGAQQRDAAPTVQTPAADASAPTPPPPKRRRGRGSAADAATPAAAVGAPGAASGTPAAAPQAAEARAPRVVPAPVSFDPVTERGRQGCDHFQRRGGNLCHYLCFAARGERPRGLTFARFRIRGPSPRCSQRGCPWDGMHHCGKGCGVGTALGSRR